MGLRYGLKGYMVNIYVELRPKEIDEARASQDYCRHRDAGQDHAQCICEDESTIAHPEKIGTDRARVAATPRERDSDEERDAYCPPPLDTPVDFLLRALHEALPEATYQRDPLEEMDKLIEERIKNDTEDRV